MHLSKIQQEIEVMQIIMDTKQHLEPTWVRQSKVGINKFWDCPLQQFGSNPWPLAIIQAGYSSWKQGRSHKRQFYDCLGFELVTAGNICFHHNSHDEIIESGCVFIKQPGKPHSYETGPAGFAHKRFVSITGSKLLPLIEAAGLANISQVRIQNVSKLSSAIKKAIRLITCRRTDYLMELSVIAYQILLLVSQSRSFHEYPLPIATALTHMHEHVELPMTIEQLSEIAGMSPSHFFRVFRSKVGMSPMRYFRELKMKNAISLLRDSDMSIRAISYALGYEDPAFFSNKFKAYTKKSPRDYRNWLASLTDAARMRTDPMINEKQP